MRLREDSSLITTKRSLLCQLKLWCQIWSDASLRYSIDLHQLIKLKVWLVSWPNFSIWLGLIMVLLRNKTSKYFQPSSITSAPSTKNQSKASKTAGDIRKSWLTVQLELVALAPWSPSIIYNRQCKPSTTTSSKVSYTENEFEFTVWIANDAFSEEPRLSVFGTVRRLREQRYCMV